MLNRKKSHGFWKCIFMDLGNGFLIFGNAFSIFGNAFQRF
jgi:hypothetical protein